MSQNRENEFENLFKRAADQYPINSDNADWAAVLRGLEEKKRRGFFWLNKKTITLIILLLMVGITSSLITGLIVWKSSSKQKNAQSDINKKNNTQQNAATEKKIAAAVYEKVMLDLKKNQSQLTTVKKETGTVTTSLVRGTLRNHFSLQKNSKSISANSFSKKTEMKTDDKNIFSAPVDTKKEETAKTKDEPFTSNNTIIDTPKEVVTITETSADTKGKELNVAATKNNTPVRISNNSKYFYAGVLYSKDKSSIRLEPNKGTGYSWALTLGYHFSKKWSVETGLHIEKKELYTTGANFDKSILGASGNILWIESEKKLLEVPITLRRDLIQKNRHTIFGSVGLSSYIVNKETIEYEEEVGGVTQNESVVFNNNTSNIFSTLNLSLGYQYKLWKIGNIRIEPYFNLPIGVIGKSKTPIISKGIYVGWTFDLHKNLLKH